MFSVFIRRGKDSKAELVLLDHGLYDKLTPGDRQALCSMYKAVVMKDDEGMEKSSSDLGVKGKSTKSAASTLYTCTMPKMEEIIRNFTRQVNHDFV